jgi:hypothetical protein
MLLWVSGVTLYQGAPGSKFSKAPLVEVPKARVERRICTSFLGVQGMLTRKMFESRLSEMPFRGLWGEILQNSDGQKTTLWHIRGPSQCFCSTAWAWGPPFGPLGLGAPGFARPEPIVVTPLLWVCIHNGQAEKFACSESNIRKIIFTWVQNIKTN